MYKEDEPQSEQVHMFSISICLAVLGEILLSKMDQGSLLVGP